MTHSILRFFRSLGESMGFDIALDKQVIGGSRLKHKGDMLWMKREEPILHLECENAGTLKDITEEIENLGSSDISFKIGVFQLADNLTLKVVKRALRLLEKKRLRKSGTEWLLIFDIWNDTRIDSVEYEYTEPDTSASIRNKYPLEYYPLVGIILDQSTIKAKLVKIYRLPFGKIGSIGWTHWVDWEYVQNKLA